MLREYLVVLRLFHLGISCTVFVLTCTVFVLTCFVMCGCFGNMCTCIYCIKYQNDIRWVSQNTTLYYGVKCQKIDNMFRPFLTHPSDIILIFDIVIAHNGDEPLKDCIYCVLYCLYCVFVLFRLCIFILLFCLYLCKDYCHRVTTQLQ